jgi:hypothetical protein
MGGMRLVSSSVTEWLLMEVENIGKDHGSLSKIE